MTIWRGTKPLILASKSPARQALLASAGVAFEVVAAGIDERAIQQCSGLTSPGEIAALLARAKALAVSTNHPGRFVLGAVRIIDQLFRMTERKTAAVARVPVIGRSNGVAAA